jgi:FMN phosphatase YigB (HAD superfamily)
MNRYYIFDLDHTIVDSSHRQATRPDGSLDLDHWREHSTPAMIEADTLLPLAHEWRKIQRRGEAKIIVCTARVMGIADYRYLTSRGLFADKVISRRDGDSTADDLLKLRGLKAYCVANGISWARLCKTAVMFDDNKNVLKTLQANGLPCYDAISLNEQLGA